MMARQSRDLNICRLRRPIRASFLMLGGDDIVIAKCQVGRAEGCKTNIRTAIYFSRRLVLAKVLLPLGCKLGENFVF